MPDSSPGLHIATLRGVPVYIGRTWPLVAIGILVLFGPQVADAHPEWGMGAYLVAAGYALVLLISVLIHEAAHAITAQACGYQVNRIVADLWGGHTAYDTPQATPGRSGLVAAVGPLSNALLGLIGFIALRMTSGDGPFELLLGSFTWSNIFVACFNALPGIPLDGGFVIDAIVWKITGNRNKSLKFAGWCGRIVAAGVVVWAVWRYVQSGTLDLWSIVWFGMIASFLWRGATAAVVVGTNREFLSGILVRDIIRPIVVAPENTPIAELPETHETIVLTDAGGGAHALVEPGAHVRVPLEQRASIPASAIASALPAQRHATVTDEDDDITAILPAFEVVPTPSFVLVYDGEGQLRGIARRADVERALTKRASHLNSKA